MSRSVTVLEQGSRVGLKGDRLVVTRADKPVSNVRLQELDQLLCFGSIELTSAARLALLRHGTDVAFLTRRGRYRGRLVGPVAANVQRRLDQYACSRDPDLAMPIARAIVAGKLRNQRNVLLRAQRDLAHPGLAQALGAIRRLAARLDEAETIESLMGFEGQGAALYFGHFGRLIKNPDFTFSGRNRRPPRDPVNACLSFGYTLLLTIAEGEVYRTGLDPMVGVFHQPRHGRPSAVLDLMEEFRPVVVDMVVLRLINRRQLSPTDFRPAPRPAAPRSLDDAAARAAAEQDHEGGANATGDSGIYLRDAGRRILIATFYKRLRERLRYAPARASLELGEIVRRQAYALAGAMRPEGPPYEPFVPR